MMRNGLSAMAVCFIVSLVAAAEDVDPVARPLVFGVNRIGHAQALYNPPDFEEHMYQRIREAGGTCVRILASPREIEREKGKRDWTDFEKDLGLALKYGQEPIVLIANTPAWASPTGEAAHDYPYKTELLPLFEDFCTDLARRTRGRAKLFQFWNEPNGCGWHCQDGFNLTHEYMPPLKACYDGLKKGNPDCVLSLGGLDDAEGHAPIFTRKTYEEKKKQGMAGELFDAVSTHPYSDTPRTMRTKLDRVREIMSANGDGNKPFWITEYGWHTGGMSLEDQAAAVAEQLKAFIRPEWHDLQAAVYLCIADFEGRNDGFGITDTNLRPRPSFYEFQAASRFGAYPAFEIRPEFTAVDRLAITWRTLEPTTGKAVLTGAGLPENKAAQTTSAGKKHRVEFTGLKPDTDYTYSITTATEGDQPKTIRSAEFKLRSPGPQVFNGDFEGGFFAGIAHGWRIEGEGFCTDASLIPFTRVPSGKHAQAVYGSAGSGHKNIASTLSTVVAATPGKPVRFTWEWAGRGSKSGAKVVVRSGIDPTGEPDPAGDKVKWSDWQTLKPFADDARMETVAENSVVRLFIQCKTEGSLEDGLAVFVLDSVQMAGGKSASTN